MPKWIFQKNQWRSTGGQSSTLTDQVVFVSSKTEKNFLLCKKNCNELSSIKRQKMLKCVFLNFRQKSFVDSVSVTRFGFIFSHQKFISKTLVQLKIFLRKYQMKKSIIPTLSEKFNEIKQTWHQLQPQM